jgi:hypothetical protein
LCVLAKQVANSIAFAGIVWQDVNVFAAAEDDFGVELRGFKLGAELLNGIEVTCE